MPELLGGDLLATLLLLVFIFQFKRISTFLNLTRVRLRRSQWLPTSRSQAPKHTRHLLACAAPGLEALGFQPVCALAAEPINTADPRSHVFADLYWHPEHATLARVELAEPLSGQSVRTIFLTSFPDGTALATVNREQWLQMPIPPELTLVDVYADNLNGQWDAHRQGLAREAARRQPVADRGEAIRREAALGPARWLAHMEEVDWAQEEAPGVLRFTPRGAWRYSGQLVGPAAKIRRALARPYRLAPPPDPAAARLAEMDTVAANIALAAQPWPTWVKTGLFVVTLVVSALLFGKGFGAAEAAALVLVLLIHECGHLVAMWAFDYRNLSVFFLPFLGAAATGHKPHASPWQEALVLLAGPVPGLLLALAATQIPSGSLPPPALDFIRSLVWFSLVLNLFNLLPFGVLDGGRLFELAVLGRFPFGRAVFSALGAAIGLLYAYWIASPVFGLAMLLLLFALPLQFRAARAVSAIRTKARAAGLDSLSAEQAIRALGREFAKATYGGTSASGWMQRLNVARLAYPRLLQGAPGISTSLGILAAQATALLGTLALVLASLLQPGTTPLMQPTAAERQAASRPNDGPEERLAHAAFVQTYEAQADAQARWELLDRYDRDATENRGFSAEREDWLKRQRALLLTQLPEDHPGKLAHLLATGAPDSPAAVENASTVVALLAARAPNLDRDRFGMLVEAYRRLAWEAPAEAAEHFPDIARLWDSIEPAEHPLAELKPSLAPLLARIALAGDRIEEADAWMNRYRTTAGEDGRRADLVYAWFLLDIGRPDQARALAGDMLGSAALPDYLRTQWRTLAGWAEMAGGRPREADIHFQGILAERAARLEKVDQQLPWWLRLLTASVKAGAAASRRADATTLDHLAALEGYQPAQAASLAAELAGAAARASASVGTVDGWGKARAAAHRRLLKSMEHAAPG
jgi:Zn-dependent protease